MYTYEVYNVQFEFIYLQNLLLYQAGAKGHVKYSMDIHQV